MVLPALKPVRIFLVTTAIAFAPVPAFADFYICNNTGSRVGVAIGYKDAEGGWTTEGWWNLSSRSCETLLKGTLIARYYYIYAIDYDRGGEWAGHAYMSIATAPAETGHCRRGTRPPIRQSWRP